MYEPPIGFAAVAKSNYEHGFRVGYAKGRSLGITTGALGVSLLLTLAFMLL